MFSKRRIAVFISVVLVLVIGILAIARYVQADSSKHPEELIGAWNIDGVPDGGGDEIHALASFFADGVVQEDQRGTGESSGHGIWVMEKRGQARFTAVELLWDPNLGDLYQGKFVVTQTLERDASNDTWSGPFKATIYDPGDNVVAEFTGTAKFTRITLEP